MKIMANCINHKDQKATMLQRGLVYCDICEVRWRAVEDIKAFSMWGRPFDKSSSSEWDTFSIKLQALTDVCDQATKAVLEA